MIKVTTHPTSQNLGERSDLSADWTKNRIKKRSIHQYVSIFHSIFRPRCAKYGRSLMRSEQLLIKNILAALLITVFATCLRAATVEPDIKPIEIDLHDQARLQRGARLFMNYCSGCHSLRYMRYSRMAKDLGLTTFDGSVDADLLMNNLVFTTANAHDPIKISMPEVDARQWFGILPPDLTLSARERGASWLYTYLKSFYVDKKRPFGANNLLVPDVAMPNILAPLQGEVILVKRDGYSDKPADFNLVLVEKGEMSQQQFDSALQDLVTFLVYVAEPSQLIRYRIGWFVLIFLSIFAILAYWLKKLYWRDIH